MKTTLKLIFCIIFGILLLNNTNAQVTGVNYQLKYNTVECRYDVYLIINSGSTSSPTHRLQSNAQITLITPTGVSVSQPINNMPIQGNLNYMGTEPMVWEKKFPLVAPVAQPESDFHSITPKLSPPSFYNDLNTGDEVKLFSVVITPVPSCGVGIRFYENGVDPNSSAPGMGGADYSNGMTIGGVNQIYEGNSPTIFPNNPVLDAITSCSSGLEIFTSVSSSSCQSPYTYQWSGPDGYDITNQDVSIIPAFFVNSGTYSVTVTDALGCKDSLEIDAVTKPYAGLDIEGCTGTSVILEGKEPTTGTWTSDPSNSSGTTLTPEPNGMALIDISDTASGVYSFIYSNEGCSDTMSITVLSPDAGPDLDADNCFSSAFVTMAGSGTGTWTVGSNSAGTAVFANPTNPLSTVSDFSDPGTYFFVWTEGSCSDTASVVLGVDCGCPVTNNGLITVNPPTYCGNSGAILIDGSIAQPTGEVYLWQYSDDGVNFVSATGMYNTITYTTDDLAVGEHNFRRLYITTSGYLCSDTSNVVNFTVIENPEAPSNLQVDSNPICKGATGTLSVTDIPGASYTWSAPMDLGLLPSTTNTTNFIANNNGFYIVSVTITENGCESSSSTLEVEVNPLPPTLSAGSMIITDPTTCAAANGTIRMIGLGDNTTYTLNYDYNGSPQTMSITSNGFGMYIISGLLAGDYTNFELVSEQDCASDIYPGPVSLTDPNPPVAPDTIIAIPNPVCLGEMVTLTVPDNPDASFIWSASSPDAGLENSSDSIVTMTAIAPGLYTISAIQIIDILTYTNGIVSCNVCKHCISICCA